MILQIETTDIILSKQRTTKPLIRMRGRADLSARLLFAYGKNRFSHDVAQFTSDRSNAVFLLCSIIIASLSLLVRFSVSLRILLAFFMIVWWKYAGEELPYWLSACFVLS